MHANPHATLNAFLNALAAVLLFAGWVQIKKAGNWKRHRAIMLTAVGVSALFFISYLIYHANVGSVPYPWHDWTRTLYFIILVPHIILAGLMVPFIIAALVFALRGKFDSHRKLVRWVWPVWMFVSITGVLVYLMLYQLHP